MKRIEYKDYLLLILLAIFAFSYVDRKVFGIVLDFIEADLHLSDTQMGIVGGIGFAIFFAVIGIPIARWADRGNRILIITLTTAVWSVAVAICGVVGGFLQLMLCRIGAAAGEAGCAPLANSLIPDYFSRAERPRAAARYYLGISIGLMVGYFLGGWLNQLYGWRTTFMIIGLPGLLLAALAAATLKEPRRHDADSATLLGLIPNNAPVTPSLREVLVTLWANRTFRHLLFAFVVWYFAGWGVQQWLPTAFIRTHHMTTGELGTWLSFAYGSSGLLGAWLGGELASRYAPQNERLHLTAAAGLFVLEGIAYTATLAASNPYVALSATTLANLAETMALGPIFASIQTLMPTRMRATGLAFVSLFPSVVGAGLGPLAAGVVSDALRPSAGEESLRYALIMLCPGYLWAAAHLWRASQTVMRDMAAAESANCG